MKWGVCETAALQAHIITWNVTINLYEDFVSLIENAGFLFCFVLFCPQVMFSVSLMIDQMTSSSSHRNTQYRSMMMLNNYSHNDVFVLLHRRCWNNRRWCEPASSQTIKAHWRVYCLLGEKNVHPSLSHNDVERIREQMWSLQYSSTVCNFL